MLPRVIALVLCHLSIYWPLIHLYQITKPNKNALVYLLVILFFEAFFFMGLFLLAFILKKENVL